MKAKDRVIFAFDYPSLDSNNLNLLNKITPNIGCVKIGLQLFTALGPEVVTNSPFPIFLDLKLHDIPETVAGAVHSVGKFGIKFLTIHACGGFEMMKMAAEAASHYPNLNLLAVTKLTSMSNEQLSEMGINPEIYKIKMIESAQKAGIDHFVCSGKDLPYLKSIATNCKFICPGVRLNSEHLGTQKEVVTPAEAIKNGASYVVIGRDISRSSDPVRTTLDIIKNIESA